MVFFVDKFILMEFGKGIHSSWPLIASIANAPLKLQGNPLFRDTIAYFPTLPTDWIPTKSHVSYVRMLLWHHCMSIVLTSLAGLEQGNPPVEVFHSHLT